jgi:nicotinamide mononucleotide transporter
MLAAALHHLPEIFANLLATASIILAGRNSVHTWWTGIVGCSVFAVVFYDARLYADVLLQLFFVGASVIGWWEWLHGADGDPLPVTSPPWTRLIPVVTAGLAGAAIYGLLLRRFTNASVPFADSTILVFSIIAQLLMMKRRVHSWPFWLLVNTIAVPVYASRGLYLTSILYTAYWVNAIFAWRHWRSLMNAEPEPAIGEVVMESAPAE